jgi:hypothetical protein
MAVASGAFFLIQASTSGSIPEAVALTGRRKRNVTPTIQEAIFNFMGLNAFFLVNK